MAAIAAASKGATRRRSTRYPTTGMTTDRSTARPMTVRAVLVMPVAASASPPLKPIDMSR